MTAVNDTVAAQTIAAALAPMTGDALAVEVYNDSFDTQIALLPRRDATPASTLAALSFVARVARALATSTDEWEHLGLVGEPDLPGDLHAVIRVMLPPPMAAAALCDAVGYFASGAMNDRPAATPAE